MLKYASQHMFCTQNENKSPNKDRDNFARFVGAFLIIIITSSGGFYIWDRYFSEMGQARRFAEEQTSVLEKSESAYIKAMTEDTYGGKTPQETLDLFVEALKVGDVDLASKYFLLKEEENFSRDKWVSFLSNLKEKNNLDRFASDIENFNELSKFSSNIYILIYKNIDDSIALQIPIRLNKFTNVWKIESL